MKQFPKIHVQALFNPYELPAEQKTTQEDKFRIYIGYVKECVVKPYEYFCMTVTPNFISTPRIFEVLEACGFVNLTAKQKEDFEKMARSTTKLELLKRGKEGGDRVSKMGIGKLVAKMDAGGAKEEWQGEYYRLCIMETFVHMHAAKVTGEEIIKKATQNVSEQLPQHQQTNRPGTGEGNSEKPNAGE
jgi:hypothetical protein